MPRLAFRAFDEGGIGDAFLVDEVMVRAVTRQLVLGLRESLSIAGQVGYPIEVVDGILRRLQDECDGCI